MIKDPTISVNKLGEYIISRGARQRAILSQRKYPDPDFNVGMFHKESVEAIQRYIADGGNAYTEFFRQNLPHHTHFNASASEILVVARKTYTKPCAAENASPPIKASNNVSRYFNILRA